MNGIVKIIITSCSKTTYWYKNMIGKVMEVYIVDPEHYAVGDQRKSTRKLISKRIVRFCRDE